MKIDDSSHSGIKEQGVRTIVSIRRTTDHGAVFVDRHDMYCIDDVQR